LPVFHRFCLDAGADADAMVHVHGFGVSGTYLEPTAALLAPHYRTFVPDLGPNNQPLGRALGQMAMDGLREPPSMLPIATRDYLRFGVLQSMSLFRAMTRYPTLERLYHLIVPTLVIAALRDPPVRIANAPRFAGLPHVDAVSVPGAHALN
jgi:hypothetical protein